MKIIQKLFIVAVFLALASCAKQDTIYKQYIVDGGYIYPAKPIDVSILSGYKRVIVRWTMPMDPSLKTAKLYWDSNASSQEFDYSDYPEGVVEAVVDSLEDRSYTFNIVNYDTAGNSSLSVEVTATPFGDGWLSSHAERTVLSSRMIGDDAIVSMKDPTDEMAVTRFRYIKKDGTTVIGPKLVSTESQCVLADAKPGQYFEYQSGFCPAEGVDTVWTFNWTQSPKPVSYNIDTDIATVTVTSNQVRDNYLPRLVIDGISDDQASRWYSAQDATYRSIFPKILVIDTHLLGDNMMTFDSFTLFQDPDADGQTRRYIRGVSIYVSESKLNPDDDNYLRNFGESVANVNLVQTEAVQTINAVTPKKGRYIAIVFRTSYNSIGYIDLWELEALGWCESKII